MKRAKNLYNKVTDVKNIIDMYNKKVKVTTKNKLKIEKFNDYYTFFIKYNIFLIREPKIRVIMSTNIKDKLVNHLVAKYFLIDVLEKDLVEENIATRKDKGTKYGIDLTKKYLNEIKKDHKNIYFLKFDISKYFYNIDHNILKKLLKKKIKDKDALDLIFYIIDSTNEAYVNERINYLKVKKIDQTSDSKIKEEIGRIPVYEYGKGLPIGNMTSQFLAIYYLNELDHFIKEKLNIKYYIRYMDDGILIHHDKKYLKYCLKEIEKIITKYKLELNNKTRINHIKNGLDFLGFRFYCLNNKIVLKVRNNTQKRFKRKIKKYNILLKQHGINQKDYQQYVSSYMGHLKMGNTFYLVRSNIKIKKDIFKKGNIIFKSVKLTNYGDI